ncbi:hypothetical protein D3C80_1175850 [compost metagenome]
MVGGHRIAQQRQHPCVVNIGNLWRRPADAVEERWVLDVGGVSLPHVSGGLWHLDGLPLRITGKHFGVLLVEHRRIDLGHGLGNFLLARPDIPQVDRLAVPA